MFNQMASYNAWCMKRCLIDGETTPVPEITTPRTESDCCNRLKLTVDDSYSVKFLEGVYEFKGMVNGRDYWINSNGYALWHVIYSGLRVSYESSLGGSSGFLFGQMAECPTDEGGWEYYDSSAGASFDGSSGLQWECLGIQNLPICSMQNT